MAANSKVNRSNAASNEKLKGKSDELLIATTKKDKRKDNALRESS